MSDPMLKIEKCYEGDRAPPTIQKSENKLRVIWFSMGKDSHCKGSSNFQSYYFIKLRFVFLFLDAQLGRVDRCFIAYIWFTLECFKCYKAYNQETNKTFSGYESEKSNRKFYAFVL